MLLELCARGVGATRRGRMLAPLACLLLAAALGIFLAPRFRFAAIAPVLWLAVITFAAARDVFRARDQLWRTATRALDDPRQVPGWSGDVATVAPTAVALYLLAEAVDRARREKLMEAAELLRRVDRTLLRDEEQGLADAVRAMIALGLGEDRLAAERARAAVPTGSDALDAQLGRLVLAKAWRDAVELAQLDASWEGAGVPFAGDAPLSRLRRLVRARIDTSYLEGVEPGEAEALCEDAKAVGDDALATELAWRSRSSSAYR